MTPTISKGILKSYPGRSKTPRSWRDQLDTTVVSQNLATQISGNSSYHVGPYLSVWYITKWKKRQLWDRGFRRNSSLQAAWDTSIARDTGLLNLVKNISPYWGGQNLTAVELSECVNLWLCICIRPYFTSCGRNLINSSMGGNKWYTLIMESGNFLVIGLKIWVGNGRSINFYIILLTTVERAGKERYMHNSDN